MIASASAALDRGHRTAARELPMLTGAELAVVEVEIMAILAWLPTHHDGTRWPRTRQLFAILCHLKLQWCRTDASPPKPAVRLNRNPPVALHARGCYLA